MRKLLIIEVKIQEKEKIEEENAKKHCNKEGGKQIFTTYMLSLCSSTYACMCARAHTHNIHN